MLCSSPQLPRILTSALSFSASDDQLSDRRLPAGLPSFAFWLSSAALQYLLACTFSAMRSTMNCPHSSAVRTAA